jgi:hypothetical protein
MTDHTTQTTSGRCPDFETLSRFADEEVDAQEAASLTEHVGECESCEELLASLQIGFDPVAALPSERSAAAAGCGEEELLLAHLTGTLPAEAERSLKSHLRSCDACVDVLAMLHRRLNVGGTIEAPVPVAVQARGWAAIEAARPAPVRAPRPAEESWGRRVEQRVSAWLRLPVLMPLSVAAGALLMVTLQETGVMSGAPRPSTRAVERQAHLRVTAPVASVLDQPHRKAQVIAVVPRGTVVDIAGEERDWYRVKLSDDRLGWVERDAFE